MQKLFSTHYNSSDHAGRPLIAPCMVILLARSASTVVFENSALHYHITYLKTWEPCMHTLQNLFQPLHEWLPWLQTS